MKKAKEAPAFLNLGGLSARLVKEGGAEYVEFFVRVHATKPKPVIHPKARKLKPRKRKPKGRRK